MGLVWVLIVIGAHLIEISCRKLMVTPYTTAYNELVRYLPANYLLGLTQIYSLIITIALGAAAAFLMPPSIGGRWMTPREIEACPAMGATLNQVRISELIHALPLSARLSARAARELPMATAIPFVLNKLPLCLFVIS